LSLDSGADAHAKKHPLIEVLSSTEVQDSGATESPRDDVAEHLRKEREVFFKSGEEWLDFPSGFAHR